jgi:hypothetical protein
MHFVSIFSGSARCRFFRNSLHRNSLPRTVATPKLTNEDLVHKSFGPLSKPLRIYRGRAFSLQSAIRVILTAAISTPFCPAQTPEKAAPQNARQDREQTEVSKPADTDKNAAQIELLETKYRFETNGNSRKEVHTRVRINNELGVRQFARLSFDFNRSFQSVEIPQVRVTHPSGGIAEILPSAITENPNPAVVDAPAYQDVRVKSVRILGLQPGDLLDYRVVTTTTHHPLAPDFWLDHTFDRSGIVSEEHFQVVLPASILASSPLIVVTNETVRRQLASRLYPEDIGCGLCSPLELLPIDPADLDPLLLKQLYRKRVEPRATQPKVPEIGPLQPSGKPLPPAEYGRVQLLVRPYAPVASIEKSSEGLNAQVTYTWEQTPASMAKRQGKDSAGLEDIPDIEVGKNMDWSSLSYKLYTALSLPAQLPEMVIELAHQLTANTDTAVAKAERIYDFVSQKINTIDLPLGASGFKPRILDEIVSSGYATQEDKYFLFEALAKAVNMESTALLIGPSKKIPVLLAAPAAFSHLVIAVGYDHWLDPSLEVAPFGALPASYRGSRALILGVASGPAVDLPLDPMIAEVPKDPPFPSSQKVVLNASIDGDGKLMAKVRYAMRGDNELLLRVAFHKTPKEKWKDVAQLLAISDGFRGQITNVAASDPYATKEPFQVEYEISQPKFVDWNKKSVRVPALLPSPGLPDPPSAADVAAGKKQIDLGTPLEIDLEATIHLPDGTTAQAPTGSSVTRDYATFSSKYSTQGNTLVAARKLRFVSSEIPAAHAADLNAFLHAVQADQTQLFTLQRSDTPEK